MRILIVGGTGHVGTYLVPRLVEGGHQVLVAARGRRGPYTPHPAWERVERLALDRGSADAAARLAAVGADVVVDMVCFTVEEARSLVEALQGRVRHFLHCGTIWVHGPSAEVPTTEDRLRRPFGDYGIRKAAVEAYLLEEARRGFPVTILHPGHIVGPGWAPLNPAGHFNPEVFGRLARGEDLALPNLGLETVHHVHADDVAQAFQRAIEKEDGALGQSFHVVSPGAVTLRGYAEAVAAWFGKPARLVFLPWEEWKRTVTPQEAEATWDHIAHSPHCSIEKARRILGYQPRYTSLQAVRESVDWLLDHNLA